MSGESGAEMGVSSEAVRAARRSHMLDSPKELAFDRLTRIASQLLKAPISLVTILDEGRQFF